jgi:hypothetical protein
VYAGEKFRYITRQDRDYRVQRLGSKHANLDFPESRPDALVPTQSLFNTGIDRGTLRVGAIRKRTAPPLCQKVV